MHATVPNILTAARLAAVPVIVIALLVDGGQGGWLRWWALVVFLVAAATDYLDGYLARRWAVVSVFGALADPIADKALILATLATLVWVDGVPWWPLAVLAVREIGITVGRLAVASEVVIPASPGGKLKTVLQLAAITGFMVPGAGAMVETVAWWVLLAAVVVALVTGVHYTWRMLSAHREITQRPQAWGDADAAA
ncbi:MAG: CDP-diacylglycerol--glycerol-3-phosphate 3-phosphatidyltransferase [Demequina sp.]